MTNKNLLRAGLFMGKMILVERAVQSFNEGIQRGQLKQKFHVS